METSQQLAGPSFGETKEWAAPNVTLAQGLESVCQDALDSGLAARTVNGAYRAPARACQRYLDGSAPLGRISQSDIERLIRRALAENLTPCTVRRNYLRVLRLAFKQAGCPDDLNPVHGALFKMRRALRVSRPPMVFFAPDELHLVLKRIAAYRAPSGRRLRCQPRDLAMFRLVAYRGLRSGELERLLIERDVDLRRRTLHVRSKVVTIPRIVELSPQLTRDVEVLTEARASGPLIRGGMRQMNATCERWKKRLGEPRLNLRNLRRSMATALDADGTPIASIGAALGHVPGSKVTNRYLGEVTRKTREALLRLEHGAAPTPESPLS